MNNNFETFRQQPFGSFPIQLNTIQNIARSVDQAATSNVTTVARGRGPVVGTTMLSKSVIVEDTDTGEPLTRANVYLKRDPKVGSTPNANGEVEVQAIQPSDIIVFSHVGYGTVERKFSDLGGSQNLTQATSQLPATSVSGSKPKVNPWLIGAGVLALFAISGAFSKGKTGRTGLAGASTKKKKKGKKSKSKKKGLKGDVTQEITV